jgi:hypothetical protein
MEYPPPGSVIDILRNTLRRLGQSAEFQQDDPAVSELKRHIVQSIAELEIIKSAEADQEPEDGVEVRRSRQRSGSPSKAACSC